MAKCYRVHQCWHSTAIECKMAPYTLSVVLTSSMTENSKKKSLQIRNVMQIYNISFRVVRTLCINPFFLFSFHSADPVDPVDPSEKDSESCVNISPKVSCDEKQNVINRNVWSMNFAIPQDLFNSDAQTQIVYPRVDNYNKLPPIGSCACYSFPRETINTFLWHAHTLKGGGDPCLVYTVDRFVR